MLGGVLWIVLFAALLGGVVALNVAVLRLNLRLDQLARERSGLEAANAALARRVSSGGSRRSLERLAQERLRLVPASSDQTQFIELGR